MKQLLVILFLTVGCGNQSQALKVSGEPDLVLHPYLVEIESACELENKPCPGIWKLQGKVTPDAEFDRLPDAQQRFGGLCLPDGRYYLRESSWNFGSESYRQWIVSHEIGHCYFNLPHDDHVDDHHVKVIHRSIMNPKFFSIEYKKEEYLRQLLNPGSSLVLDSIKQNTLESASSELFSIVSYNSPGSSLITTKDKMKISFNPGLGKITMNYNFTYDSKGDVDQVVNFVITRNWQTLSEGVINYSELTLSAKNGFIETPHVICRFARFSERIVPSLAPACTIK